MQATIPAAILKAVESGNAILFLGAGASYDALLNGSPTRVYADNLRDKLADEFLGGAHKNKPLVTVADYARNEASLARVQGLIRQIFLELTPAPFHLRIPTFRWRAIVSTNYDLVIERAYEQAGHPLQSLSPVTRDGGELERALSGQNTLPYLKLHGCINNYTDSKVPIVLDSQEYAKFESGRENLVKTFAEWAAQSPIIFCGYSLSDENIKEILFDIGDQSQSRDAYLYVSPKFDDIELRYWSARRIVPFPGTFSGFLETLDGAVPAQNRKLATLFERDDLPVAKWIPSHDNPSDDLVQYLAEELVHVPPNQPASEGVDARNFYCGLDTSFTPIFGELDVRRTITDEILNGAVLDTLQSTQPKFFLLKGYAGCGKSVLAKRVAIETSRLLDAPLVVWLREGSVLRSSLIVELQTLVKSRLYVFVDDAIEHQDTLPHLMELAYEKSLNITVVACGRTNELNIYGQGLFKKANAQYEIFDLNDDEVHGLLGKLSAHKILGPLEQYSTSERRLFVDKFYNQQLLVALHEITFGDSFEDILISEFEKISPREAQQLYLDICTLHQSGVGVRAGLLSRITGVPITKLNDYLNGPLSRVVRGNFETRYRDYVYKSRHNEIAKMVFSLAISDPEARAQQLRRILSRVDLDYSSDNNAFFELVRGKRLAEMFERKELAISVFDAASQTSAPQGFLYHQRAILELNHRTGNLDMASEFLKQAEAAPRRDGYRDSSVQHTKANLLRRRANSATTTVERERYRADARSILKPQLMRNDSSYPEHLLGQVLLDELRDYFAKPMRDDDDSSEMREQAMVRLTTEISRLIDSHLRTHPDDAAMTLLRTDFLKTIGKQPQALDVLKRFHAKNPEDTSITRVFGEALSSNNQIDDGIEVLRGAVLVSPTDKAASLALAKLLIKKDEFANAEAILSHLRRSFSDGDSHYEARMLFARCNLLYGDLARGQAEFVQLRDAYMENRDRANFVVTNPAGEDKRYSGTVVVRQAGFGFIRSAELRFNVYLKKSSLNTDAWSAVQQGTPVEFSLAFTYRGPAAIRATLV
ncbi:SIR2 family protein [Paraburkholderia sediminicola]|uniref:SIR2 family protein n=1 Tax=Paraburkholderia sediminicola TaxID=458836 RepID=UPI0038BB018A